MKDKATKSNGKKPIFKKWWFWVIIVVILAAIFGNTGAKNGVEDGAKDAISSTEQQATSDKFVEDVKTAISGAIDSDNEAITDVALKDKDLCVTVDLSKADPSPLTIEDLAISRTSSITDAILELTDYDSQWNTITVDFGDVGKVVCDKDSIKENEAGVALVSGFSTTIFDMVLNNETDPLKILLNKLNTPRYLKVKEVLEND